MIIFGFPLIHHTLKKERLEKMRENISKAENIVLSGSLVDWGDELIPFIIHIGNTLSN